MNTETVIAIDFGTTHCRVAALGRYPGHALDRVTVFQDRDGRVTIPTALLCESDRMVVGREALDRAGGTPAPVLFSKRWIGTDRRYRVGDASLLPDEVAAHVIRHLKTTAESAIGAPVRRAILTVPTCFDFRQSVALREAANAAALEVEAILPESVAAALRYAASDRRDPLRILVYDLGGGTFDAAVVERREGVLRVLGFDGDPAFGGYNIDKALANRIARELGALGHDFALDFDRAEDRAVFTRLMAAAEDLKIRLSSEAEAELPVGPPRTLADRNGRAVDGSFRIRRDEFNDLVRRHLEQTVEMAGRAILNARLAAGDLDEVIMVGGSSRIPLVTEVLQSAFQLTPRLVDPDLCVVAGAALLSATLPRIVVAGCRLLLDPVPVVSPLPDIALSGRAERVRGHPAPAVVAVERQDGKFRTSQPLEPEGGFFIDEVPLLPNGRTSLRISLNDEAGRPLVESTVEVRHDDDPAGAIAECGLPPGFLGKPLAVDGSPMAGAAAPLPFEIRLSLDAPGSCRQWSVPLREQDRDVGRLVLGPLPVSVPAGTVIELRIGISADFRLGAEGSIPALGETFPVSVDLPPLHVPTLAELNRAVAGIESDLRHEIEIDEDAERRVRDARTVEALVATFREELESPPPERMRLARKYGELRALLTAFRTRRPAAATAWAELSGSLTRARELLGDKPGRYDRRIERLQALLDGPAVESDSVTLALAATEAAGIVQALEAPEPAEPESTGERLVVGIESEGEASSPVSSRPETRTSAETHVKITFCFQRAVATGRSADVRVVQSGAGAGTLEAYFFTQNLLLTETRRLRFSPSSPSDSTVQIAGLREGPASLWALLFQKKRYVGGVQLQMNVVDAADGLDAHSLATRSIRIDAGDMRAGPDLTLLAFRETLEDRKAPFRFVGVSADPGLGLDFREFAPGSLATPVDVWFSLMRDADMGDEDASGRGIISFEELRPVGMQLFDELLPADLKTLLSGPLPERVRSILWVSNDTTVPWHILKPHRADGERPFLAESYAIGLWPLGTNAPGASFGRRTVRVAEARLVDETETAGVRPAAGRELQTLRSLDLPAEPLEDSGDAVLRAAGDAETDLIHIAARSDVARDQFEPPRIYFGEDRFSPEAWSGAMRGGRSGRLWMFVSCSVDRMEALLPTGAGEWVGEMARGGVGALVMPWWLQPDDAARRYVQGFYERILKGETFGAATRGARDALEGHMRSSGLAFCLFGDPTAVVET